MRTKTRLVGRLAAVSAVAVATVAVAASSASAFTVGKFSPAGPVLHQGTLTLTHNGQSKTCNVNATANVLRVNFISACSGGGTLDWGLWEFAGFENGSPAVSLSRFSYCMSPWGEMPPCNARVPVVNGNASTPSKIVFNNTEFGRINYLPVTVTGDITITTSTGGLVTVVP